MSNCSKLFITIVTTTSILFILSLLSFLIGGLCRSKESSCYIPEGLSWFFINFGLGLLCSIFFAGLIPSCCNERKTFIFFYTYVLCASLVFTIIGVILIFFEETFAIFGSGLSQVIGNYTVFIVLYFKFYRHIGVEINMEKEMVEAI